MCGFMHVSAVASEASEVIRLLELEAQAVLTGLTCMLGTELVPL